MRDFILILAVSGFMFLSTIMFINKYEQGECLREQRQSKEYVGYYAPDWLVTQCQHHGVDLSKYSK